MRIAWEKRYIMEDLEKKIEAAKESGDKYGYLSKILKYLQNLWLNPEKKKMPKIRYRIKYVTKKERPPARVPGRVDMEKVSAYLTERRLWPPR